MTKFARATAPSPCGPTHTSTRFPSTLRGTLLAAGLTLVTALLAAAPAAAIVVKEVGSEKLAVPVGLQPRIQANYLEGGEAGKSPSGYLTGALPATYGNPQGNPVLHATNTWTIVWDPTKYYYHGDWQNLIDSFMSNMAAASGSLASVFSVDGQYTDHSNQPANYKQSFRGGLEDTTPYPKSGCEDPAPLPEKELLSGRVSPTTCLTSTQVANHLESYIKAHNLPRGMNNVYYLLTPPGVTICLDDGGPTGHCSDYEGTIPGFPASTESYRNSFCSYHSDINPGNVSTGSENTILYGVIPWTAGSFKDPDFFVEEYPGWECQDGGYNPASKPTEQYEKERKLSETEEKEFEKKNEKEQAEELEAKRLEGPHEQEPNQQPCPTEDGGCDHGLADLIINQIGVEQQNIVTDPLLTSWKDSAGYENTDECRFLFAPILGGSAAGNPETDAGSLYNQNLDGGTYYLNDAFDYAGMLLNFPGVPCLTGSALVPRFTAPSPINSGEVIAFDGMESDIALNAGISYAPNGTPQANYAVYTWNFGDGTPTVTGYAPGSPPCGEEHSPWLSPCAGSVLHSYEFGGTYEVTLTVRDIAGDTASVTHQVTVFGPPRPTSSGNAASTGTTSSGSGSGPGTGSGSGAGGRPVLPSPVAAALILPQSLRTALRKGLTVSYSVNQQVAGHFEVFVSSALAHKLHLNGTPATGLPVGAPPEMVIAKAILVTSKAGRSTVHIVFSKRNAGRLAHVQRIPFELRLIVHNAAAVTATVVSSATLGA